MKYYNDGPSMVFKSAVSSSPFQKWVNLEALFCYVFNTLFSKPLMALGHSNLLVVIIFLYWPQLHVIKYSRQPTQHTIYIDKVMPEYQNILPSEVSRNEPPKVIANTVVFSSRKGEQRT